MPLPEEPEELLKNYMTPGRQRRYHQYVKHMQKNRNLKPNRPVSAPFSRFNSLKTDFSVLKTRQTNVTSLICTEASLLATAQHTATRPPPGLNLKE